VSIDVENADELFELYPLAMMPAVKQYKALIESVRMAHRGYVARQQMDAHIVVFDKYDDVVALKYSLFDMFCVCLFVARWLPCCLLVICTLV